LIIAPLDAPASILAPREELRRRSNAAPAPAAGSGGDLASAERRRTKRNDRENLFVSATVSGQSKFAGLYDRPIAAGGMIKDNINTDWDPHDWRAGVFVPAYCRACYTGWDVVCF
jgi:hypothetical protein